MDNEWDLFIDLEKYVYKVQEKENKIHPQWNRVYKKPFLRTGKYLFTIVEEKEYEFDDYFKNSPVAEKNKYINQFNQYKLKK
jgi:hypothetical protein